MHASTGPLDGQYCTASAGSLDPLTATGWLLSCGKSAGAQDRSMFCLFGLDLAADMLLPARCVAGYGPTDPAYSLARWSELPCDVHHAVHAA